MADEKENTVKTNYSTVAYSYDNHNSCMSLGFAISGSVYSGNNETDSITVKSVSGTLALAPVLPNMVGKRPSKGVQQYGDYNSQLRCFISPENASRILKAINDFLKSNSELQYISIDLYPGTVFEFGYADGYLESIPKNVGNSLYLGLIQTKDNTEEVIYHLMLETDIRVGYQEQYDIKYNEEGKVISKKATGKLEDYVIKDSFFHSFKKFLEKIASYDMQANIAVNSFNSKLYGNVVGSTKSAQSDRTRHSTTPQSRRTPRQVPTVNTFSSEEVADDSADEFLRRINGENKVGEDVDITLEIPTTNKVEKPKSLRPSIDINDLDDDVPNFEND
jgi:hypothetical protein